MAFYFRYYHEQYWSTPTFHVLWFKNPLWGYLWVWHSAPTLPHESVTSRGKKMPPPVTGSSCRWCYVTYTHQEIVTCPALSRQSGLWNKELLWQRECKELFSFSSVTQSCPILCDPMNRSIQASLCITNSQSPPKPMSIESVMPSNHLILCHPLLLGPSIFPSIRVSSNESALHIRWPKYWSFSFNISPSNEHPGLISFRMDWLAIIREIQIKTTISYCFTLAKMAIKKDKKWQVLERVRRKGTLIHCCWKCKLM